MNNILATAKNELQAIEAAIIELGLRREKLEQFIALYEELGLVSSDGSRNGSRARPVWRATPLAPQGPVPLRRLNPITPSRGLRESDLQPIRPMKYRAADACEEILLEQSPLRTSELAERLKKRQIEIGGNDPVMALSAILSKDDRFVPSRKVGWRLASQVPDAERNSASEDNEAEGSDD